MFELNFYDIKTEELIYDKELKNLSHENVKEIFGFDLEGCCADVNIEQLNKIEKFIGENFNFPNCDVSICEVED